MRIARRLMALMTLAGFLVLAGIDLFHHHATIQEKTHCSTCKVIAQNSALPNSAPAQKPAALSRAVNIRYDFRLSPALVFPSHGLSPPIA